MSNNTQGIFSHMRLLALPKKLKPVHRTTVRASNANPSSLRPACRRFVLSEDIDVRDEDRARPPARCNTGDVVIEA